MQNINRKLSRQMAQPDSKSNYKKEIVQIVFDLGEGKQVTAPSHMQETLRVFLDSNPSELAVEFCHRNQLREDAVPLVEETIWTNLQSVFNDSTAHSF